MSTFLKLSSINLPTFSIHSLYILHLKWSISQLLLFSPDLTDGVSINITMGNLILIKLGTNRCKTAERKSRATAEYPATIVPDCTCAHIFKERDMCRNKFTQVAGYSAVKLKKQNPLS